MDKSILIVDDEPHIVMLLEQSLEIFLTKDVKIHTASNGEEALSLIKSIKPDIVYLDIMMPKMNGFEVCNEVKNVLGLKDVYIVMLTAKGQEIDRLKSNEVGADTYVTKPFDPDTIVEKTEEVLGIKVDL